MSLKDSADLKKEWESMNVTDPEFMERESRDGYQRLKALIQKTLANGDASIVPLSAEQLLEVSSKVQTDVNRKGKQLDKMNEYHHPRTAGKASGLNHSRQDSSSDEPRSNRSSASKRGGRNRSAAPEPAVGESAQKLSQLQKEIGQLEAKLKHTTDFESLAKLEALVKNKEIEVEMLERKNRAVKVLQGGAEVDDGDRDADEKQLYVKRMDKLTKEVRHYEDLHNKLQDQVARKDENLKKHTEVVERLYEKYIDLCRKNDIEARIRLEKSPEGVIDVTLPEDTKIGKQMELKKYNAEVKLTKSNKIAECQKRFAQRVEKKEIPSLREWIAKQDKLYSEIQKKIEKCEGLYEKYKHSGYKTPIDSNVFAQFERLRELYSRPYAIDDTSITKVEELLQKLY